MTVMFSTEVCQRAGITYRQLDYWIRRGVVTPVEMACPGSGFAREFDNDSLFVVAVLARLRPFCEHLDLLARVAQHLSNGSIRSGLMFVTNDGDIEFALPPGTVSVCVDLDAITRAVFGEGEQEAMSDARHDIAGRSVQAPVVRWPDRVGDDRQREMATD